MNLDRNKAVESKFETISVGLNMVEKSIVEKKAFEIKDKEERKNNVILYKVPKCLRYCCYMHFA